MQFHSMSTISLLTAVVFLLLVLLCCTRSLWTAATAMLSLLVKSRKLLLVVAMMVAVLLLNSLELTWEQNYSYSADFTPWVFQLEGHFVSFFQQLFHAPGVTLVVSFFYLVVFQALILASLFIYAGDGRQLFVYATCCTVMLNYLVALPFYALFPVNEVWSYPPSGAAFYMLEAFPEFNTLYRPLSGINNCFPSLHTSVSVSMAMLAIRSGNRKWAIAATASAAIIVFSIFYLGIHWLTDMIGGLLLATLASGLGLKWARRLDRSVNPSLPSSDWSKKRA
ncbi:phosphatase PAP2 family protein [Paenibacillus sanfengchensis]|uniref:phosphatase PAP2 family protein n=1 Tax=Paenibacillus sanfengchensis TaxID=3119819 RepID=UPI002FE389CE